MPSVSRPGFYVVCAPVGLMSASRWMGVRLSHCPAPLQRENKGLECRRYDRVDILPFLLVMLLSSNWVGGVGLLPVLALATHSPLKLTVLFRADNRGKRASSILSPRDPRVRAMKTSTATMIHSCAIPSRFSRMI